MSANAKKDWIALRITSVAAIPLCVWFVASIVMLAGADYDTFIIWMKRPLNAGLMITFIVVTVYHAMQGVHEILEDYVHGPGALKASLVLKVLAFLAIGAVCVGAVVKIAFL
jgi:succinate dehydrogenase / fumarate reductase membrane anchor subunit